MTAGPASSAQRADLEQGPAGAPGTGRDPEQRADFSSSVNPQTVCLMGLSACQVAEALNLQPHREGGFFRETYRASTEVATLAGARPLATAILYLLTPESPSCFHRLAADELWFWHAGGRVELWLLPPEGAETGAGPSAAKSSGGTAGTAEILQTALVTIGPDNPSTLVPARRWMGARVAAGSDGEVAPQGVAGTDKQKAAGWALVSCVVTPGFEYEDFELADREVLLREHPAHRDVIVALT